MVTIKQKESDARDLHMSVIKLLDNLSVACYKIFRGLIIVPRELMLLICLFA